MPKNKNALIRYRLIDERLRNKHRKYPTKEDLREHVSDKLGMEISESTIEKDMKAMRNDRDLGYMAPIAYHSFHKGYYYTDENFTIANVALTEDDLDAINFATTVLQQFKENPVFSRYSSAIDRIVEAVNLKDLLDTGEENFIHFEQVPKQIGVEWLPQLIAAIRERKVMEIKYQRFIHEEEKTHFMHPYLLKEYRNRWYVIGMHHEREFVFTLGLDRIQDLAERKDLSYRKKARFDPESYFENVIGITVIPDEPQEVELKFTGVAKEYAKSLPWHHSQQIIDETKNQMRVSLFVAPTPELKMKILENGDQVEVLKPYKIRDEIQSTIDNMSQLYK